MYHELLERLALILAKTEGWEIEDIHAGNPRMKIYLKMAASCLGEIANFVWMWQQLSCQSSITTVASIGRARL
jgi:hypothetical protein